MDENPGVDVGDGVAVGGIDVGDGVGCGVGLGVLVGFGGTGVAVGGIDVGDEVGCGVGSGGNSELFTIPICQCLTPFIILYLSEDVPDSI